MLQEACWKLLFDADCSLCRRFATQVSHVKTTDCLQVISLQLYYSYDQNIPLEELMKELHLLGPQKEVFRGGEALQKLFVLFPMCRPFRWMLESKAGQEAGKIVYGGLQRLSCRSCRHRR